MTDTELLDALQALLEEKMYTGRCMLRMSTSGRGWRLLETSSTVEEFGASFTSVREAIETFVKDRVADEL